MLNKLYEKIEAVLNHLDVGGEQSRAFEGEIALLKELLGYPETVQDDWDEAQRCEILAHKLRRLAVEAEGILISLPTNPVAQWFDGTYQDATIDMQFADADLSDLFRFIVDVGVSADPSGPPASVKSRMRHLTFTELSPESPKATIPIQLLCEYGKLWIRPSGYGDACSEDGQGYPVALELWQGRLRLVVFSDINAEEPQVLDLENARENHRSNDSNK